MYHLRVSPPAGRLGALGGTHTLLAPSPRRGKRARRRWFASVNLSKRPAAAAAFDPRDVTVTTCRAGGPGGQHVNTSATAVHALHRPTGLRVRAADERSQAANRRLALARLAAALAGRTARSARARNAQRHAARQRVERGGSTQTWRVNRSWQRLLPVGMTVASASIAE